MPPDDTHASSQTSTNTSSKRPPTPHSATIVFASAIALSLGGAACAFAGLIVPAAALGAVSAFAAVTSGGMREEQTGLKEFASPKSEMCFTAGMSLVCAAFFAGAAHISTLYETAIRDQQAAPPNTTHSADARQSACGQKTGPQQKLNCE